MRQIFLSSVMYKSVERWAAKIIGIVVQVLMARYIGPSAFGVLAILVSLDQFAEMIMNSGSGTALIQWKNIRDEDYSTAFFCRLFGAGIFFMMFYFGAPYVAQFFSSPDLFYTLRVYAVLPILKSFSDIRVARLQRDMKFRELSVCQIAASFFGGIVGIILTLRGLGLWALVCYSLSQPIFLFLFLFYYDRWFPKMLFRLERAKKMFLFGIKILGANLLVNLYVNSRVFILGHYFSMRELAYYDRGKWIGEVTVSNIDGAIQAVLLPALSREQDSLEKVFIVIKRVSSIGILIITPLLVGISLMAEPIILLMVTSKWISAVPFVQVLSLAFISVLLTNSWMTTVVARGNSGSNLKIECYRKIVQITILIYSMLAYDSVMAIAQWFVVGSFIDIFVTLYFTRQYTGYGFYDLFQDSYKPILATGCMAVVVYVITINWQLVGLIGSMGLIVEILTCGVIGGVVYAVLCYLLKAEAFLYLLELGKEYLKK